MMKLVFYTLMFFILFACNNQQAIEKKTPTQLDSLMNFDTIVAIYSYSGLPPIIDDDVITDDAEYKTPKPFYIDSVNKWTDSRIILDSIKKIFPRLRVLPNEGWETSSCMNCYKDLLIETKHHKHILFFVTHSGEGTIKFDDQQLVYKTSLDSLEKIVDLLNRKIIIKEIPTKDIASHNLNDVYNKTYRKPSDQKEETTFVYVLK